MPAKHLRRIVCLSATLASTLPCIAAPPARACRQAVIEGEVTAGQPFLKAIGGNLALYLQPIASGWIIRIVPASGPRGEHDYAELATPPYNSVTALSLSTDFAFRAQDAVGWNPRRFHFATNPQTFSQLLHAYQAFPPPPASPPASAEQQLASLLPLTSQGTLRILDARMIPGTADQTPMAATVASHFASTAHTVDQLQTPTPLGKLLWLKFRTELDLPPAFVPAPGLKIQPSVCSSL
ncbi:hypothetical protein [Granulicella tundricola]|uniref:Lipoprotein n=1 Tax=Granulicella tundricola (strain ATCC BAA-1859 / DSM 23138 / MP5ACTX9) TaxID=1198114 RepID=E8X385_GRATM|nr:hypothetical protein [Granulicella tundricola]ADW69309.1 hypothetical protein AciX9_2271 [Granulicella tundricola MP5ACTX9]